MERSVLKLMLAKAGLSEQEEYKKLLEGDAADIPVTDAVGGAILAKLLTIDDAVKNTEVKQKLKPVILADVDNKAVAVLTAKGLSEDDAKKLIEGKNSVEKWDAVIAKVDELNKATGKQSGDQREAEWVKERDKLTKERDDAVTASTNEKKASADLKFGYDFRDFMADKEKSGLALSKTLPVETQLRLIREDLLNSPLVKEKGLTVGFSEGKLRYFDKEGNVYKTPGIADEYDPRGDLQGISKRLGFVEAARTDADPPRDLNLPPRDDNQKRDTVSQSANGGNLDLIAQMEKQQANQPPPQQ